MKTNYRQSYTAPHKKNCQTHLQCVCGVCASSITASYMYGCNKIAIYTPQTAVLVKVFLCLVYCVYSIWKMRVNSQLKCTILYVFAKAYPRTPIQYIYIYVLFWTNASKCKDIFLYTYLYTTCLWVDIVCYSRPSTSLMYGSCVVIYTMSNHWYRNVRAHVY